MKSKKIINKTNEKFPPLENKRNENHNAYPQIDFSTSKTMIYITNYELRDYQLQMAKTAVHYNTLISIPTGLGKTFIGAVLIANFHRWFPTGKIIFTVPSRPLLIQQMREMQKILKYNDSEFTEISGSIDPIKRIPKWQACSIFFGTPQAIQNDIESGACDASQIVLIVIDEAHRAHGDYSYCKIISMISSVTSFFRVVGLTATPGNYFSNVQDLIHNLLIEKVESSTCDKYKYKRKIEKITIPKAEGVEVLKDKINEMIYPLLIKMNKERLTSITDPDKITKGVVAMWNKQTQSKSNHFTISKMIKMLGWREKLEEYSIDIFDKYLRSEGGGNDAKTLLKMSSKFQKIDLKMEKLKEIVQTFLDPNSSSEKRQIIIFSNYRLVVEEIVKNLTSIGIRCAAFVGQSQSGESKGLNRSRQLKVIDLFKRNLLQVLVSTSIGEEGLDVGDVDLIVCYDIQKSLTRMVQRIGRTGRKRNGNVIFLINEGSKFDISCELDFKNDDYFESYADNFLQSNMRFFEFFKSQVKMIPDKLEIIYKKIDDNDGKSPVIQNVVTPFLTDDEKCDLNAIFGTKLMFNPIENYLFNEIIFKNHSSNESQILFSLFNKKKITIEKKAEDFDCFEISSDDSDDEYPFSQGLSSSPSFSPISKCDEYSFLDKNIYLKNKNNEDENSPDGFSQIARNNRIFAPEIIENNEFDVCKINSDSYSSDEFVNESDSFISASYEIICSESDDSGDEIQNSPTFIKVRIY